jgi:hypothetical protein
VSRGSSPRNPKGIHFEKVEEEKQKSFVKPLDKIQNLCYNTSTVKGNLENQNRKELIP